MAVATLALGIGVNASVFSVAHAFLLQVWQVREPGALVFVRARGADGQRTDDFGWTIVDRLRLPSRSLAGLSAFDGSTITVTVGGESEVVYADFVTGHYFQLLGLHTPLGRPLTIDDDRPGRAPVAVISHAYWQQRFGGDPRVIGTTIRLKDLVCTIVGVAAPDYFGQRTAGRAPALTLPMTWHAALGLKDHLTFALLGRLRDGVSPESARQELDTRFEQALIANGASTAAPATPPRAHIELQSALRGEADHALFAREIWILQLVGALVLLLATVNVASLQLARGVGRAREFATRLALGATRGRLVRQLLAESVLVTMLGGLCGVVLAQWGAQALLLLTIGNTGDTPSRTPLVQTPVLMFTLALIALAALICGIAPAMRLTRRDGAAQLSTALRARSGDRAARGGWALIVAQVALSIVLLIPAALLIRSVDGLARVDLGFDPNRIAVMAIYPTLAGYEGPREIALYRQLLDRLNATPGVEAASFSRYPILRRARWHGLTIHADRDIVGPGASFVVDAAAPRLFDVMGLRLLAGRDFDRGDVAGSAKVAIINHTLAMHYFQQGEAVGHSVEYEGIRRQIVGVVSDMRFGLRDDAAVPAIYIAYTQAPADMLGQMWLKIRTSGDPANMMPTLRREILSIAPTLAPTWSDTASRTITDDARAELSLAKLVSAAGAMALFLAMVGLYANLAQAVTRRTREIGLRMALGAQQRAVTTMILREAGRLVLLGIATGVPLAWSAGRLVSSFLFGVTTVNPAVTAICCVFVVLVATVAAFMPARRAAGIDPLIALQQE